MDYEMKTLQLEGYADCPDDRRKAQQFEDMCDNLEAEGFTSDDAINEASKHF
jgi:hypothetical protein